MLTDKAIQAAQAQGKDYKLADGGGLYLFVTTKGFKSWRLKYRFGDKEKRLILGSYPGLKLAKARLLRDEAKAQIRAGQDPAYQRKLAKAANQTRSERTFEKFAREWHGLQESRWKPVHAADVIESLERDVFPQIGHLSVTDIDEGMVLATLKKVEARGAVETAHRLRQRISAVFKFAKPHAGNGNPADVKESMAAKPASRRWPALKDLGVIRDLIAVIDTASAHPITRLASRMMALTAQRPGMVRRMRWSEIEGIDWAKPDEPSPQAIWTVPADQMKLEFDLRANESFSHCVPLTEEAVAVLRAVRRLTERGPFVFPSCRDATVPMSENSVGYLYNRMGYKKQHVAHGWRSSFSTLMNEHFASKHLGVDTRLVIERLVIDLMLAHRPAGMSATELVYNQARFIDRRREIAQMWATLIMDGQKAAHDLLEGPRRPLSRSR